MVVDDRDTLRAEVDHLTIALREARAISDRDARDLSTLRARVAELERELSCAVDAAANWESEAQWLRPHAERYKWLTDHRREGRWQLRRWSEESGQWDEKFGHGGWREMFHDDVTEAIDAARATESAGGVK